LNKNELERNGLKTTHVKLESIGRDLTIETPVSISNSIFSGKCDIGYLSYARDNGQFSNVSIGRYCSIAPNVVIGGGQHPLNWLSSHPFVYDGSKIFKKFEEYNSISQKNSINTKKIKVRVSIGNDVWIGEGATIKQGITIGDGAVIGTRSVVTKDIPPYAVVAGVPAKIIKYRFDEDTIKRMLKVNWWNYDLSTLADQLVYPDPVRSLGIIESSIEAEECNVILPKLMSIIKGVLQPYQ
jgi:acetyltransferase-like isoleucine patch superfamily enzyme